MKNLCCIFFILFLAQGLYAQSKFILPARKAIVNPNIRTKVIAKPIVYKPDLTVLNNIQLVTQNGKRYLYANVKNIGNVRASSTNLGLRISWRVDYESWSNVERNRNYRIPALNPGQQYRLCVSIPDHEIHSNEGYGSNNASFRFTADKPNAILEISEQNNRGYKSVPILRD